MMSNDECKQARTRRPTSQADSVANPQLAFAVVVASPVVVGGVVVIVVIAIVVVAVVVVVTVVAVVARVESL
jgi:hypothetical protein